MDVAGDGAESGADVWVIQPRREGLVARLRDVWRYRKLIRFFAVRAVTKLYQRTILGVAWIFIRPLFPLVVNTLVFGGMLGVGSQGVPYFVFLVTGTAIWELFANSVTWGTRSLELNRSFMSRVYVPRLIMPVASVSPAYVNFGISLAVLLVAAVYYRVTTGVMHLTPALLGWSLAALALTAYLALGIALWTSVPALQARDVRFTLAYVLDFWIFLTPVLYPIRISERFAWVLAVNPMVAIVDAFKYGLLGIGTVNVRHLAIAAAVATAIFASGLWFFSRAEADAADKV